MLRPALYNNKQISHTAQIYSKYITYYTFSKNKLHKLPNLAHWVISHPPLLTPAPFHIALQSHLITSLFSIHDQTQRDKTTNFMQG